MESELIASHGLQILLQLFVSNSTETLNVEHQSSPSPAPAAERTEIG